MARSLYGGRLGDQVFAPFEPGRFLRLPVDATGAPTSTVLTVWDEPDGTLLDNLLTYPGLAVIDEVVVPATGQIPAFMGPDGYNDGLWLRAPDGVYYRLDARGQAGPAGPAGPAGADGLGTVNSVNGQSPDGAGAVTVPASAVGSTAVGGLAATNVQDALAELDSEKQPSDADLTAIAALTTTAYGRAFLELLDAAAARSALALGTAATEDTGTGAGQIPILGATPGTPDGTKYLADDLTWKTPTGGGGGGGILTRVSRTAASDVTYTTTTAAADGVDVDATNLAVTFTATTTDVDIVVEAVLAMTVTGGGYVQLLLRSGTSAVPNTERAALFSSSSGNQVVRVRTSIRVTGLTVGTAYTYKLGWRCSAAGPTATMHYGVTKGPILMEVYPR